MYDVSSRSGLGWCRIGRGGGELFDPVDLGEQFLWAGDREHESGGGTFATGEGHDGVGGLYDECCGVGGDRDISDAELRVIPVR